MIRPQIQKLADYLRGKRFVIDDDDIFVSTKVSIGDIDVVFDLLSFYKSVNLAIKKGEDNNGGFWVNVKLNEEEQELINEIVGPYLIKGKMEREYRAEQKYKKDQEKALEILDVVLP